MRNVYRIIYRFTITLALFFLLSPARAQNVSNEGLEFYSVFPTHVPAPDVDNMGRVTRANLAEYSIFITGKQASSGTVSVGGRNIPFNLTQGNSVVEVKVPRADAYIDQAEQNRVLLNRAIKILVDPGKPKVVVYGHIFAGRRSAASLILPKEALGQEYFTMNYQIGPAALGGMNHIVITAAEPDTKVLFHDKDGKELVPGGVLLPSVGDVYEFLSPADLTGTNVFVDPVTSSCKKFALFSGTTNSSITLPTPCVDPRTGVASSDPLYQQNYPIGSWGKTYGFVPFSSVSAAGAAVRTNGNYIRVLAKEDNTKVLYNGTEVAILKAGQAYTTPGPVNEPAYITANNPIAVAQYALSVTCAGGTGDSDADMVILNPIEYNIKNITLYSSPKEAITEQYINVVIKTSAIASFKVNAVVPAQKFMPLKGAPEYSYLQLNLNPYKTNSFNLLANDGFNAIAYGFGFAESYAYSAGTNLASSQFASVISTDTKEEIKNACRKEAFNIKVTLTSPVSNLSWQFETNGPLENQIITNSVPVVRNGTTFYDYYFPRTISYQTAGQKTIKVIAKYPSIGGCALSEQQIDLIFDIYDPPVSKFITSTNFCAVSEIKFTDQSIDNGNAITAWHWDFGDGKTSREQNPVHTYSAPGTYIAKLLVENSTSCDAIEYQRTITISSMPVASFTFSKPGCNDTNTTFTDNSTIPTGSIVKWKWDLGDGTKLDRADNLPFNHKYAVGGNFQVILTVISSSGCENTLNQTVNVPTPFLEAGNDIMVIRGGAVTFDVNATGTNLRYKWSPSIGLDRDDVKNPVASPSENTRYTLTITSEEGCVLSDDILVTVVDKPIIHNTFTPNGDGVNDVWEIKYLESYPEVRIEVFNRFGVRVYTSIGYKTPWNGTLNGSELPVGTYYYMIDPGLGIPTYSGWVTIIR